LKYLALLGIDSSASAVAINSAPQPTKKRPEMLAQEGFFFSS